MSLAVGMASIFSALPGMSGLMAYWYQFALVFEALFILTTIDTGTRVGRYLVQEMAGKVYAPFRRINWIPGVVVSSGLVVGAWAYLIGTGSISTIWPMFGAANQLLGMLALCIGTTVLISFKREEDVTRKPPVIFPCDTPTSRFDLRACRWSIATMPPTSSRPGSTACATARRCRGCCCCPC